MNRSDYILHSSEQDEIVQVQVTGFGNLMKNKKSLVLLLTPVDEELNKRFEDVKSLIFPVVVPPESSILYFYRMSSLLRMAPLHEDLNLYFAELTGAELISVSIIEDQLLVKGVVHYRKADGSEKAFYADLPDVVYVAIRNQLPINIEIKLLLETSRQLKINYPDDPAEEIPRRNLTTYEIFISLIDYGVLPDSLEGVDYLQDLKTLTPEEREKLLELALSKERYEWAELLRRKENRDHE